jgi:hypothetical protein
MEDTQEYTYEQNAMVVVDFMDGVIPNRNLFKVYIYVSRMTTSGTPAIAYIYTYVCVYFKYICMY